VEKNDGKQQQQSQAVAGQTSKNLTAATELGNSSKVNLSTEIGKMGQSGGNLAQKATGNQQPIMKEGQAQKVAETVASSQPGTSKPIAEVKKTQQTNINQSNLPSSK